MLKKFALSAFGALLLESAFVGCGPKVPADMPTLYPVTVKVVDGNKGIQGVNVVFLYEQNPVITGETDSNGVAEMKTTLGNYTAKGVPEGSFRVTCAKDPTVEHWKTAQERAEMSPGEAGDYMKEWQAKCDALPREIPKVWKDFDKTPLKAEVASPGGEFVFDVEGKAND